MQNIYIQTIVSLPNELIVYIIILYDNIYIIEYS